MIDTEQITVPMSSAEGLHGGACLGVRGSDSIVFFDWDEGEFIRKIDVAPQQVSACLPSCLPDSLLILMDHKQNRTSTKLHVARLG